jgi:hypothetical protein
VPAVLIQLSPPTQRNPTGVTAQGDYEETGGKIILTAFNGRPLPPDRRKRFTHRLREGESGIRVAKRLTHEYSASLRTKFSGPIRYQDHPVA